MDKLTISQADIARHLSKENATVSRWIKYDRIPSADYSQKIADFLGVELRHLLTGVDPEADPLVQRIKNDDNLREMLTKIVGVDKKYWKKINHAISMAIELCVDDEDKKERAG